MSRALFLVEPADLAGPTVRLSGPEGRHAATVRRLAVGEPVDVADGTGRVADCVVTSVHPPDVVVLQVRAQRTVPPPSPRLVVVQALPKGERGELAVATMTEVGVDLVVPWAAARCVTQWRGPRGDKALRRWRATAREAAKQSRRARVPEITELAGTAQVASRLAAAALGVVLHEQAPAPLATVSPPAAGDVVLVVGPEGGLTDEELAGFTAAGAGTYRLGPTVLRTSTAGVAALAVLLARTARWA